MTKYVFLARLEEALAALDPDERRATLQYYEEYFEDNAEAADTLSPEQIAAETLASYGIDSDAPQKAEPQAVSPPRKFPVGRLVGGILLSFLAVTLGSVALGMICASAILFVVAFFILQLSVPLAVTVFGSAILALGLFGLSLGGTVKSVKGATNLFKNCEGGEAA